LSYALALWSVRLELKEDVMEHDCCFSYRHSFEAPKKKFASMRITMKSGNQVAVTCDLDVAERLSASLFDGGCASFVDTTGRNHTIRRSEIARLSYKEQ
jgi:hypothetical protein